MFMKTIFGVLILMLASSFTLLGSGNGDNDEKLECEFYSYQEVNKNFFV